MGNMETLDGEDLDTALCVELQPGLSPSSVGAKSANLGKAMEHGFHVPPGCVVTRKALTLFLEQTDLFASIQACVESFADLEQTERTKAYEALCDEIIKTPIPQTLIDAVEPLAKGLLTTTSVGLAVRSSGIYEDSATASFAGIYESFLGIRSVEKLWEAIRKCWCAAWSPSALDYAKKMGIEPEPDAMAVLVQELVPAESAGVLFTAHPQTGNPWRFTLESTFGLAQELVGSIGATPADRFVFAWDTGEILEKEIAEKPTMWISGASGVEKAAVADVRRTMPSLQDEMAARIAQQGLDIDRAFECRVDIEWVVANGEIYVVQVRPITALPTFFPHHLPLHLANRTWRLASDPWAFDHFQGKIIPPLYRDLSVVENSYRYWIGLSGPFMPVEADFNSHRYLAPPEHVFGKPAEQMEAYLCEYEPAIRHAYLDAKHHKIPAILAKADDFIASARSTKEIIEMFIWARDVLFDLNSVEDPPQSLFGVTFPLLQDFVAQHLPGYESAQLVQGYHPDLEPYYPHAQFMEAKRLAQAIGQRSIRRDFEDMEPGPLIAHLLEKYADSPFMALFGDYCSRFGLFTPDWLQQMEAGERHRDIIRLVQGMIRGQDIDIATIHKQTTRQRQARVTEVRQNLNANAPENLPRFERLLDWALFWGPALSDRGWFGVPLERVRAVFRYLRPRLVEVGLVAQDSEFGYFTVEDLAYIAATEDIEEGRRILEHRRLEYERYARLQAPAFLGKPPDKPSPQKRTSEQEQPPKSHETASGSTIPGKGSVPGQCSGLVRKVNSLAEVEFAGEEHVLLFVQPVQPRAANTPALLSAMLRVRGIVAVQGPMMWMHHLAQIARECGVPIVQISPEDMARIPDGAELAIDGSKGTVILQA